MSVYIISKGLYYAGGTEWIRNRFHAYEFDHNYGAHYGLIHALRFCDDLKRINRLHLDARPIRFLDSPTR